MVLAEGVKARKEATVTLSTPLNQTNLTPAKTLTPVAAPTPPATENGPSTPQIVKKLTKTPYKHIKPLQKDFIIKSSQLL